jgi:tRNA(fMet)-specific endonuclease VapC
LPYLIDTNIAIHAFDGHVTVSENLTRYSGSVVLSVLSLTELLRGLHVRPSHALARHAQLQALLGHVPVLSFDTAAAEAYGRIIAQLGWVKGRDFDRMIAAHAISSASTLVTANAADFRDIPGLKIENWSISS